MYGNMNVTKLRIGWKILKLYKQLKVFRPNINTDIDFQTLLKILVLWKNISIKICTIRLKPPFVNKVPKILWVEMWLGCIRMY